ncbi:MAG: sensor histidine kinase [Microcystaceae cyanobacterium]
MDFFTLLLGILVGLAVGAWQRDRFKKQLLPLLKALPDTPDVARSLSLSSLIRREITHLAAECQDYRDELELWQGLIEQAPFGYLRVDQENHLRWCNPQAQSLLNIDRWQPDQLRLVLELVRSYELDQLIEQTRQLQAPQTKEWVFYPAPESVTNHPAIAQASQSLRGHGYPLANQEIVVFLEDLQPLTELQRNRDRAFSDVTHELRTPLTSIALVTEMLEQRLQNPEKQWVIQMESEIERLQYLVENWLFLAEIKENPVRSLHYKTVELQSLINLTWQRLEPFTQPKQITLDYQGLETVILQADCDRLTQVFFNLFDNAIKHSPIGGTIQIAITDKNQTWQISLTDEGEGFSPTDLPYVFERLYRGESSRSRQGLVKERQGSGLGLAIAKEVIEAHRGTITAANNPLKSGACLTIQLPKIKDETINKPLANSRKSPFLRLRP